MQRRTKIITTPTTTKKKQRGKCKKDRYEVCFGPCLVLVCETLKIYKTFLWKSKVTIGRSTIMIRSYKYNTPNQVVVKEKRVEVFWMRWDDDGNLNSSVERREEGGRSPSLSTAFSSRFAYVLASKRVFISDSLWFDPLRQSI